jgi:hypothetical protein
MSIWNPSTTLITLPSANGIETKFSLQNDAGDEQVVACDTSFAGHLP